MLSPPTILLAIPSLWLSPPQDLGSPQEPIPTFAHHQADLPSPGSEKALLAQEEFRAWMDALDLAPVTPLYLDYQFQFEFQWLSPSEGWDMTVDGSIVTEIQSPKEIHYLFKGLAEFGDKPPVHFECDLLLDGEFFWVSGKSGPDLAAAESFLVKGDQILLHDLYDQYLEFLPVMAKTRDIRSAGMGEGIGKILNWLPADLETYMHPAGYMRFGTRIMTCRRMAQKDGILDADMTLDMSEGSVLGMITSTLRSMVANEALSDPKTARDLQFLRSLGEDLFAHIRFDAATGTPLGMDLSLAMSFPADKYIHEDSSMKMRFQSDSISRTSKRLEQAPFAILAGADDAYDVTPFLQMAQARMQAFVDEIESEEDADF